MSFNRDNVHLHSITFMSRFTSAIPSDAPVGAMSDALTSNALTVAGACGLAGVGVMSVAVTATILPAQTICLAAAATAALVAGKRQAEGKSFIPSFGGTKQDDAPATTTVVDVQAAA